MKINFSKTTIPQREVLVCFIGAELEFGKHLTQLDSGGTIKEAVSANKAFKGDDRQAMVLYAPAIAGVKALILIGVGNVGNFTSVALQKVGAKVADQLNALKIQDAELLVDSFDNTNLTSAEMAVNITLGVKLRNYNFSKYFVDKKEKNQLYLGSITVKLDDAKSAENSFSPMGCVAEGVLLTRDLVSEPPNVIYPKSFMEECLKLKKLGVKLKVLD